MVFSFPEPEAGRKQLSLANESQYLLVNAASVRHVQQHIEQESPSTDCTGTEHITSCYLRHFPPGDCSCACDQFHLAFFMQKEESIGLSYLYNCFVSGPDLIGDFFAEITRGHPCCLQLKTL